MKGLYWIAAGAVLAVLGLVLWFTAWIAWPLALVLVLVGVYVLIRDVRCVRSEQSEV